MMFSPSDPHFYCIHLNAEEVSAESSEKTAVSVITHRDVYGGQNTSLTHSLAEMWGEEPSSKEDELSADQITNYFKKQKTGDSKEDLRWKQRVNL